MSILFRSRGEPEVRGVTALSAPLIDRTNPGVQMDLAMRLTPVYAAVSLISEALISCPLHAYRDNPTSGKVRMPTDPPIVADPGVIDSLAWRGQYVASMLLRGNAYGLTMQVDGQSRPTKIIWLHPDKITVDQSHDLPRYMHNDRVLDSSKITHIRSTTLPGSVVGLSPIQLFRSQLSSATAAAELQANIYRSGGPAAHFKKTDRVLTADESDIVKSRFRAQIKAGDLLVTGSDWEYTQLGMSPADAQFVESAKLTANQVAAIFHVPADEIGGETGSSLTYSTLEMNDLKFIRRGIVPLAIRLEAALTKVLPSPQYVKFNLDSYIRTDLITRMQAHQMGLEMGLETLDEGRALEDKPPLTEEQIAFWAEQYHKHSTALPIQQIPTIQQLPKTPEGAPKK